MKSFDCLFVVKEQGQRGHQRRGRGGKHGQERSNHFVCPDFSAVSVSTKGKEKQFEELKLMWFFFLFYNISSQLNGYDSYQSNNPPTEYRLKVGCLFLLSEVALRSIPEITHRSLKVENADRKSTL